jgi:hypothetical protein
MAKPNIVVLVLAASLIIGTAHAKRSKSRKRHQPVAAAATDIETASPSPPSGALVAELTPAPGAAAGSAVSAPPTSPAVPASAATPMVSITAPAPKPPGNFFVHVNMAMNAFTYLGPANGKPETYIDPSKRVILLEQVGLGYYFHRMLRAQLSFQFGETLTAESDSVKRGFSLFAIIAQLVFTHSGFAFGVGPIVAPISYGTAGQLDAGIFTSTGYAFKLPKGFSIAPVVTATLWFNVRFSASISPTLVFASRF